jgi:predicted nucleotidyltransferase
MLERKVKNFFTNPGNIRKFGIELAYLFGSVADGRFTAQSDIDVAVLFTASRRSQEILQKSALLQIELRRQIHHPIDFVILNFASPLLKHEVIGGHNLFAVHGKARREFESKTAEEYKKFEKKMNLKFKRKLLAPA